MSEETKKDGISYFPDPDNVVRVPSRQRGRTKLIDTETGRQTFPEFVKRATRDFIYPEDLDEKRKPPTDDDHDLRRLIEFHLHANGFDLVEGVPTDPIIDAIMEIKEVGKYKAYPYLYSIWHAGLVKREGVIHRASERPMKQLWYFN